MIEEALVAALRAGLPTVTPYPSLVPEGAPLPWIVYREVDSDSEEGFYTVTNTVTFELDAAIEKGLLPSSYRATKVMANDIRRALRDGFQTADVCVYNVDIGKRQDMIDDIDSMHWTRATYTLTFDTPIGE